MDVTFNQASLFIETLFEDEATFFSSSIFNGKASFARATFKDYVHFGATEFHKASDFNESNFNGGSFGRTCFTESADFDQAILDGRIDFTETHFFSRANFYVARIRGLVDFRLAEFHDDTTFVLSIITGTVRFIGDGDDNLLFNKNSVVMFQHVNLREGTVEFRGVYVGNCSFLHTEVEGIAFVGVDWGDLDSERLIYDDRWSLGKCAGPDSLLGINQDPPSSALVDPLYLQLRRSYEAAGDYAEAGKFYTREMDRRLALWDSYARRFFSLAAWYKYISGYGENYVRASVWLLLTLLLWTFAYTQIPFQTQFPDRDLFTETSGIVLDGCRPFNTDSCGYLSWPSAAIYTLLTMVFFRTNYVQPIGNLGRLLIFAEKIIGTLVIALLALAVRRRFRR